MRNFNLRIQEECPQCGAPVEIEEESKLLTCDYCGVTHIINFDPLPLFVLGEQKEAPHYLPFWRIRGCYFVLTPRGVDFSPVDGTLCALKGKEHLSLGLKPRIVKSYFVHQARSLRLVPPQIKRTDFLKRYAALIKGVITGGEEVFYETFMGEWFSLLYVPCFEKLKSSQDFSLKNLEVRFFPALCPRCGADLLAQTGAEVFFCPQCVSSWKLRAQGFEPVEQCFLSRPGDIWLPFWRIGAQIKGPLLRITSLPAFARLIDGDLLSLLLPAFRLPPRLILRLARQINLYSYQDEVDPQQLSRPLKALTPNLKAVELFQILPAVIGALTPSLLRAKVFPRLKKTKFAFVTKKLCWLPFKEGPYEYLQTESLAPVPKKAVQTF